MECFIINIETVHHYFPDVDSFITKIKSYFGPDPDEIIGFEEICLEDYGNKVLKLTIDTLWHPQVPPEVIELIDKVKD